MSRKELSDGQWNQIKDHLPPETGRRGRPAECNRLIINAVLRILGTGAPRRDVPGRGILSVPASADGQNREYGKMF